MLRRIFIAGRIFVTTFAKRALRYSHASPRCSFSRRLMRCDMMARSAEVTVMPPTSSAYDEGDTCQHRRPLLQQTGIFARRPDGYHARRHYCQLDDDGTFDTAQMTASYAPAFSRRHYAYRRRVASTGKIFGTCSIIVPGKASCASSVERWCLF